MKKTALVIISALFLFLAACGTNDNGTSESTDSGTLEIYTTLYPIEFLTKQITGDHAHVTSILPAGADAHSYEPTVQTIVNIAESNAFIFIGEQMESYAESIKDTLKEENVLLISLGAYGELFENRVDHGHQEPDEQHEEHADTDDAHAEESHTEVEHHHGDLDPHFWLDPIRMIDAGKIITEQLSNEFPEYEQEFQKNFEQLEKELTQLDQQFREQMQTKEDKTILVAHAAYGYWEARYGIEQLSIRGLTSSNQPSQKELENIAHEIQEKNLTYMIMEQNTTDRLAAIIANELNLETIYLHNLSSLTDEDLEQKKDYMTIMNENLEVLDQALQ